MYVHLLGPVSASVLMSIYACFIYTDRGKERERVVGQICDCGGGENQFSEVKILRLQAGCSYQQTYMIMYLFEHRIYIIYSYKM